MAFEVTFIRLGYDYYENSSFADDNLRIDNLRNWHYMLCAFQDSLYVSYTVTSRSPLLR